MSILGKLAGLVPGGQVVAAWSFVVDHWKAIVVGLLVVGNVVFWALWRTTRAEFDAFESKVAAERAQQEEEDAVDEAASIEYVANLNREHDETKDRLNRFWAGELDRLHVEPGREPATKPVQPPPRVCADEAGNNRLSDALGGFREEIRAIVADERSAARSSREDAARLLGACERQAAALDEVVRWAEHEHQLWGEDGAPMTLH